MADKKKSGSGGDKAAKDQDGIKPPDSTAKSADATREFAEVDPDHAEIAAAPDKKPDQKDAAKADPMTEADEAGRAEGRKEVKPVSTRKADADADKVYHSGLDDTDLAKDREPKTVIPRSGKALAEEKDYHADLNDPLIKSDDAGSNDDADASAAEQGNTPPPPVPQEVIERVVEKRGGFFPALLGGILAAALGFIAGRTELLDSYFPALARDSGAVEAVASVKSDLAAQGDVLAALQAALDAIEPADLSGIEAQVTGLTETVEPLQTAVGELSGQLGALDGRITTLEKQPVTEGVSEAAIAAYEAELSKLEQAMATQRGEVEKLIENARAMEAEARALEADAAEAAELAASRTAVAQLRSALDSGAPYRGLVDQLAQAGIDMPDPLVGPADEGVATMATLRRTFPAAAREALSVARSGDEGERKGLGAFLMRELGARSVAPRDGTDADAVLSRAEAALTEGELSAALSEVSVLSENAQAAMSNWLQSARTRAAAIEAADGLAQSLNSN